MSGSNSALVSVLIVSAILFAVPELATADDLSLVLYNESYAISKGARCLDGSPAGYYVKRAPAESPNADKWVVFLEGGGLCVEPFDCKSRKAGGNSSQKSNRNY